MLSRLIRTALTTQHAPSTSNGAIATTGLKTSAGALAALQKGSIKNSGRMAAIVPLISGEISQTKAQSTATRMGQITHEARMLETIEPQVTRAAKDWVKAETARAKIVKEVSAAGQKVAELNAKTQAEVFFGHTKAHSEVSYYQSAHNGANFSV